MAKSERASRLYARKAKVELPSLGEYERQRAAFARGTKASEPMPQVINA